jgi:hypothetical protein
LVGRLNRYNAAGRGLRGRPGREAKAGREWASGSAEDGRSERSFGCGLSELRDLGRVGDHRQVAGVNFCGRGIHAGGELLDGAIVHSVIRGNGDPLREARAALPALIPAP